MNSFLHFLYWLSFLPAVVFFGYIVHRNVVAWRIRPHIAKEDIIYQENFASGASQKNFLTKFGGARNCLRLVVTRDLLWVSAWFPFSIFAALYDCVHAIPLDRISSVQASRYFGEDTLLLSYTDAAGQIHTLRLIPKDRERFLAAIGTGPDDGKTTKQGGEVRRGSADIG